MVNRFTFYLGIENSVKNFVYVIRTYTSRMKISVKIVKKKNVLVVFLEKSLFCSQLPEGECLVYRKEVWFGYLSILHFY